MPLRRDWMHIPIKCYQCRWQCPKSPQCQIQLQILPTQQTIIGTHKNGKARELNVNIWDILQYTNELIFNKISLLQKQESSTIL
jgi:hypothetical protein